MMVMLNSEYRNSFKPANEVQVKLYEQNLDFRTTRKSAEFHHNPSAFCWEGQEWEKGSQTSIVEEPRPGTAPSFKYKHKLYNKLYQENHPHSNAQTCPAQIVPQKSDNSKENGTAVPPLNIPLDDKINQINSVQKHSFKEAENQSVVNNAEQKTSDKSLKKPTKPNQQVVMKSSVRPSTAPPKPIQSISTPRAPFVMYGSKDKECHIANLRTFNIRASTDIYPSALRAQQYRQAQKEKKLKSAPVPKRKPLSFDQIMDKQTSCWQTEYKGHFVTYNQDEYRRSLSSRLGGRRHPDP